MYLVINHGWHAVRRKLGQDPDQPLSRPMHVLSAALTFLAVVAAWVVFRADSFTTAIAILKAMAGMNGFILPYEWLSKWGVFGQWLSAHGIPFRASNGLIGSSAVNWISISLLIVWFAPNTQQIMAAYKPALDAPAENRIPWLRWRPSAYTAIIVWLIGFFAIINLNQQSAFLYFQF